MCVSAHEEMALGSAFNMRIKDSASKRKRVNRSAKPKQCKFEARRRQWLSNQEEEKCKGQERKLDAAQAYVRERPYCYILEAEDGWEAAADALGLHSAPKEFSSDIPLLGAKPANKQQHSMQQRAWMQNDPGRPASLPRPNKQRGQRVTACPNEPSDRPQCPICIEELDNTDTLFDLCPCGFNLCLFCYHRIATENGRCPGCRGVYIRDVSVKPVVLLPR